MNSPEAVLDRLRKDPVFRDQITFWHTIPQQAAVYDDLPAGFIKGLKQGINIPSFLKCVVRPE